MAKKKELLTYSEYARFKKIDPSAVSRYVSDGKLTLVDGKIDPVKADIELAQTLCLTQEKKINLNVDEESKEKSYAIRFNEAKVLKMESEASLAQIELKVKKGELVPVRELDKKGFDLGRIIRDNFKGIAIRISSLCATETQESKIYKIIDDEITQGLENLGKVKNLT